MKLFVSALIVLSSAAAFAMPAVGDYAKYNMTVTSGSAHLSGTLEQELTQSNSSGQFMEKSTATVSGQQPQIQQNWVDASNLLSDATLNQIVQNCAAMGGSLHSVTVPAGTFNACAITNNDGNQTTTYLVAAGIPFGIVEADIVTADGQHTVATLASYRLGH